MGVSILFMKGIKISSAFFLMYAFLSCLCVNVGMSLFKSFETCCFVDIKFNFISVDIFSVCKFKAELCEFEITVSV